ncbi:MAG: 30S ribosome-binding factor RbfA [bacterium]
MRGYDRAHRVGDLIKEEISWIIQNDLKDPRVGFVTVTSVEVSRDLQHARIYISLYNKDEEAKTLEGLSSAIGYIKKEMGRRIRIKYLPDITFIVDRTNDYGARIDGLLSKIDTRNKLSEG